MEDRHNDVLTAAIGKPEHPGRVRGQPLGYVGMKKAFGKSKRKSANTHDACNQKFEQVSNSNK